PAGNRDRRPAARGVLTRFRKPRRYEGHEGHEDCFGSSRRIFVPFVQLRIVRLVEAILLFVTCWPASKKPRRYEGHEGHEDRLGTCRQHSCALRIALHASAV